MAVYQVQANGQAPPGLKPGDTVQTAGGLYSIVHPGTPGSKHNTESGYSSIKVGDDYNNDMLAYVQANSERNTAKSQEFAREQMNFQTALNAKAMEFSANQAELNRQFQERLSNTAHQREVADLVKAGLNPVLSAMKGNGASQPSGSSASGVSSSGAQGQVDTTLNQMVNGLLSAIISQSTALQTTSLNNIAHLRATDISAGALLGASNITAKSNQAINQAKIDFDKWLKENYPQNVVGGVSTITNKVLDAINGKDIKSLVDMLIQIDRDGIDWKDTFDANKNK